MCFTHCYSCLPPLPAQSALNQINPDHFHGSLKGYWCCGPQGWWQGRGAWGETRDPVILLSNFNAKVLIFLPFTQWNTFFPTFYRNFMMLSKVYLNVVENQPKLWYYCLYCCLIPVCSKFGENLLMLLILSQLHCFQCMLLPRTMLQHLITGFCHSLYLWKLF